MTNIDNLINRKVPVRFFKNDQVKFENNALEELQQLLGLSETIDKLKVHDSDFFTDNNADIVEVAITRERIKAELNISKAAFKRAVCRLLKEGAIEITDKGIKSTW